MHKAKLIGLRACNAKDDLSRIRNANLFPTDNSTTIIGARQNLPITPTCEQASPIRRRTRMMPR